jgi:hypothetical protein
MATTELSAAVKQARDVVCDASADEGLAVAVAVVTRDGTIVHVGLDSSIGGPDNLQKLIDSVGKTVTDFVDGVKARSAGLTGSL